VAGVSIVIGTVARYARNGKKLQEAEIPGREVEFDPDEAERIAFREDALSDEDARESIADL
jgi:hypothetical protein